MTAAERMKEYERLSQNLQQRATVPRYQQDFEKAYGEATNYNADLIGQRSDAIGRAQALPNELRQQYASSAIRNPLAQEALISTRRGNITSDISRLTDLLGARGSRFQDVLGKYTQGYQADLQAEQMALENQWRLYQDALAREEAEKARAAAAAQQAALADLIRSQFEQSDPPPTDQGERVFEIPGNERSGGGLFERRPAPTNLVQDALASGILRYQNAPNALAKYGELMRGSALSSLGGIPGITSYTTALAPSVWGDIKGGVSDLWNKLRRR